MKFPQHLNILLAPGLVTKGLPTGEVITGSTVHVKLLNEMAKALGFTYKLFNAKYIPIDGSKMDFFCCLSMNEHNYFNERAIYPYQITEDAFVIKKPGYVKETFAFIKPFPISMWLSILFSIIFASAAHYLIFRSKVSISSAFFYIFCTLFGQLHDWRPKSLAEKMLVLTWSVGTMFITFSYLSVLLSFLTVPVREKGIINFDDLYKVLHKGTVELAKNPTLNYSVVIEPGDRNENDRILLQKLEKGINSTINHALYVVNTNVAFFGDKASLHSMFDDAYRISEDSVFKKFISIFDIKVGGFCCAEKINQFVHRSWATALYAKILDDTFFKHALKIKLSKEHTDSDDPIKPLTLSHLSAAFYFLLAGQLLGILCLLCEICVARRISP